jgi:hypothetical protein
MITDELIKEKLPRKEARELFNISRSIGIPGVHFLMKDNWADEYFENMKRDLEIYPKGTIGRSRAEKTVRCYELYSRVSDDPKEIMLHWNISWQAQRELHKSYKSMAKPPKQDNKTYLAKRKDSDYSSNRNKIRYPRKKRKTAWKRFYKLFPHLKHEENS